MRSADLDICASCPSSPIHCLETTTISSTHLPECAVIGAGPAGLCAAECLARAGARVTIYDQKPSPARKFLMAGRGGLNITHSENIESFLVKYGVAANDLAPFIRCWPPQALRDFCAELGEETFVGSSGRVFPKSFKASPLLRAWLMRLQRLGVRLNLKTKFNGFADRRMLRMVGADGMETLRSVEAVVLALGGGSWPKLGSDALWVNQLKAHNIHISPLRAANCGVLIDWSGLFRCDFEGQPIKNVVLRSGAVVARGDIMITRTGLEGGPVYTLSSSLQDLSRQGKSASLFLDLRPETSLERLMNKLSKRQQKQSHATYLKRAGFSRIEIAILRESACQGLPRDVMALAELIKNLPLTVRGVAGLERAISTAGGVSFDELTPDLMLHKLPGVFLAGEMLDFDAPTGGYLLQACFSTGRAAGEGAGRYLGLTVGVDG